jgi:hypothetical protein
MTANNANVYLPGTIAIPSSLNITAITQDYPMVCTIVVNSVTESNTYIAGQVVRLFVPYTYGMFQANGLQGKILSVSGSNISLDIDSRNFDVFAIPASNAEQPASLAPCGSQNLEYSNLTDSVGFQSLNNRGN